MAILAADIAPEQAMDPVARRIALMSLSFKFSKSNLQKHLSSWQVQQARFLPHKV